MKVGTLVGGAFLLIIGFAVFAIGYSNVQAYNSSVGLLAQALSSDAQAQAQTYEAVTIVGGVLALIGFVVCIYGAAASEPTTLQGSRYGYTSVARPSPPRYSRAIPKQASSTQASGLMKSCPACNKTISSDNNFCPFCATDLRMQKAPPPPPNQFKLT